MFCGNNIFYKFFLMNRKLKITFEHNKRIYLKQKFTVEKQSTSDVCVLELTLLVVKLTLGEQKVFLWLISCDILGEQKTWKKKQFPNQLCEWISENQYVFRTEQTPKSKPW